MRQSDHHRTYEEVCHFTTILYEEIELLPGQLSILLGGSDSGILHKSLMVGNSLCLTQKSRLLWGEDTEDRSKELYFIGMYNKN